MKRQLRWGQAGFSLLGFMFFGGVLAFGAVIGAKAVPAYIEYFAVQKAVKKASAGNTVPEIRASFDKAAQIDNIESISGKDIEVGKEGDKVVVSFAYNKEIHLGGHAYLVFKYSGSSR